MQRTTDQRIHSLCVGCYWTRSRLSCISAGATVRRRYHSSPPLRQEQQQQLQDGKTESPMPAQGAMSRRLAEMSEEALETGGRSAQKAVEEAGFSEDLKKELQERIASAAFRSENAQAFAQASLRSSAGAGTRDVASAQPWTGTESITDASLRMLDDARKPMRVAPRSPTVRLPTKVDTGRTTNVGSRGARLANARDKTSIYATSNDPNISDQEREQFRKQLKERFAPGARALPATLQGLASLANERIDDAIARGQFKNLPRGKKIERDYTASSPFLDTTEYFMNKIIQKQEIVPPWIEKQQELVSTAARFRGRLRNDWKRHVARTIASQGGTLEDRIALAEEYALAEAIENPPKTVTLKSSDTDNPEQLSQITPAGELQATTPSITIPVPAATAQSLSEDAIAMKPTVAPFRDPLWQQTELSYQTVAIENLNSMTRSYNLMAPDLAKKPYFFLDRELRACYADVAPLVAEEIRERARVSARKPQEIGHRAGGVMEKFSGKGKAYVHDERKPRYGFREFWRDLFA